MEEAKVEKPKGEQVGKITHYFAKIGVAVIEITSGSLKVGDEVHIKGHTSNFKQKIGSMQVEHDKVETAEAGKSIGVKVDQPVRAHDLVFKV